MYLLMGFLGLALLISPYLFGYSVDATALWTSLIIGAILVIDSILEGIAADRDKWEYWVAGFAGVVAILAPFVLGFTATSALWTLVIVGVATVLVSGSKLLPWREQYR